MTTSEFKTIFDEYRMFVFYYCKKRIFNTEDAEDLTCQVFTSLWKQRETVNMNLVQNYISTIARNKCIDYERYKSKRIKIVGTPILEEATEDTQDIEVNVELLGQIYNIIESLPPLQKKFIKMKYIEGKEPALISKLLNRNGITIRNQLSTALSKIRKELKNRGFHLG